MPDIRSAPDQVDAAWLTDVLRCAGLVQSARVTDLPWAVVGAGMLGDSVGFSLTYDHDERGPASVAAKFPQPTLLAARSALRWASIYQRAPLLSGGRFYRRGGRPSLLFRGHQSADR